MPPTDKDEAQTRLEIDSQVDATGWVVQDFKRMNLYARVGVAVREATVSKGRSAYLLFIDAKFCSSLEVEEILAVETLE